VAAEKLIKFDATLGINPIFFAVSFSTNLLRNIVLAGTSQQNLSQRGNPLKLLPSAGSAGL
jgi:hypothetical protein